MMVNISDIDIQARQIHSKEQEIVLETLANSVAKKGSLFLEVGSWCGDSAVILGKIAKKNNGLLFCVDWWKGNPNTELHDIAQHKDVFSFFWNRICREGLEDVVVPVRARSDLLANIFKENTFDLVFIDADHSYKAIKKDIEVYAPLVKINGGILCGHDCPGYVSDFEADFLASGKDMNILESVHCGVVLAVSEKFDQYSVNHNFWSLKSTAENQWKPTELNFSDIENKKQTSVPSIRISKEHSYFRVGKLIYAVPHSLFFLDLSTKNGRDHGGVLKFNSLKEAESSIGQKLFYPPEFLSHYFGFRIFIFNQRFYGIEESVCLMASEWISQERIPQLEESAKCFVGNSEFEIKKLIDNQRADKKTKKLLDYLPFMKLLG